MLGVFALLLARVVRGVGDVDYMNIRLLRHIHGTTGT